MLLLSLVTHIPQSTEGEEEEERGCRSRTMTDRDHLPFWGAEIGQWLGKHVSLPPFTLSLSPPLSTLSHFYPIPTKPKIARERAECPGGRNQLDGVNGQSEIFKELSRARRRESDFAAASDP